MEYRIMVTIMIQTILILLLVLMMVKITVRARKTPVFWSYIVIQASLLLWLFGCFMGTVAPTKELYDTFVMVQLTGIFVLPVAWLLFCKSFRDGLFLQKTQSYILGLINGLLFVLLLTNSFHGLLIRAIFWNKIELGRFFGLVVGVSSLEFFVGLWILLKRTGTEGRKRGTYFLAIAGLSGFGVAVFSLDSGYSYPFYFLGIIPMCMFICFIEYSWQDSFGDLSAGAFDVFMRSIRETILIFDTQGRLIECNSMSLPCVLPFTEISTFENFKKKLMEYWVSGNPDIFANINNINGSSQNTIQEEIGLKIGNQQEVYYNIVFTHLGDCERMGMVITLRDISQEKELEKKLEHKNTELERINGKLLDYITIAHQLEEEKERNLIVLNINITVGKKIAEILTVLDELLFSPDEDGDDRIISGEKLNAAINLSRLVLDRIREAVAKLMPTRT